MCKKYTKKEKKNLASSIHITFYFNDNLLLEQN